MNKEVHGTVKEILGDPEPWGFKIEDDDGKVYFAHLGDIRDNELKLYKNLSSKTTFLEKGDEVQFTPIESTGPRAIHIKGLGKG